MLVDGAARWVAFDAPDYDTGGYEAIGAAFEMEEPVARGVVGMAESRLFSLRAAVDFAGRILR